MTRKRHAKEFKCVKKCGRQAVAFWPVIDPDIPSSPYCRSCLDKIKMDLTIKLMASDCKELEKK